MSYASYKIKGEDPMVKDAKFEISKILRLWKVDEKTKTFEWKQYHVLREEIRTLLEKEQEKPKKSGISSYDYRKEASERTIMRWLSHLVATGELEKRVEQDHKTYYRPKDLAAWLKEILKGWIDFVDIPEILDYLNTFSLTLNVVMQEKREKGETPTLLELIEATNRKVEEYYRNKEVLFSLWKDKKVGAFGISDVLSHR